MKIIEYLSDRIAEEIDDAHGYAMKALEVKETYPDLANVLHDLSTEEMGHMSRLHTAAAGIIEQYRNEKGEPPAAMMAVYDYLHKKQIAKAAEVKNLQEMFAEK